MKLDEIKISPMEIVKQQFVMFEEELKEVTGEYGWVAELNQYTKTSVVVKAYWADENGSDFSIKAPEKLAHKYFVDSNIAINYGIDVIDEQGHHSLYQLVLGW